MTPVLTKILLALLLSAPALGGLDARERRQPDTAAAMGGPDQTPPVLLEVRRTRRGETRVRVRTTAEEAPGSEAPEAFWIGFYNSVTDVLYPSDGRRAGSRKRKAQRLADPGVRLGLLCAKQARELAAWQAESLAQRVGADESQRAQLQEVAGVAQAGSEMLGRACGPLDAHPSAAALELLLSRVQAMQTAADAMQPPLARFVDSLRPDQREKYAAASAGVRPERDDVDQQRAAVFCGLLVPPERASATVHKLARTTRPRADQARLFNDLMAAVARSQQVLHQSCALQRAGEALAQLEVMQRRLRLTAEAVQTVKAALSGFSESLDGRQRRSLARLGYGDDPRAQASR